ncbi:MAG TPA: hypothetical protein VIH90_01620 [Candidatus Saccharimonadales bacterium]
MPETLNSTNIGETPPPEAIPGEIDINKMETLYHVQFPQPAEAGRGVLEADFGTITTPNGELYVSTITRGEGVQTEDYYDNRTAPRRMVEVDRSTQRDKRNFAPFAPELGFLKKTITTEDGKQEIILTAPTVAHLNSTFNKVYETTSEEPPFEFVEKQRDYQGIDKKISGKEYVEALAEGKVVWTTPEDDYYDHDTIAHLIGFLSLDPETFGIIKEKASELLQAGKLSVDENGVLTEREAGKFVVAVDQITTVLNSDLGLTHCKDEFSTLLGKPIKGMSGGLEIGRIAKRLNARKKWVTGRLKQIDQSSDMEIIAA